LAGRVENIKEPKPDTPGGWNRIKIEVDDIEATVNKLKFSDGASATLSSPAMAAGKSSSRIRPTIRSSTFSRVSQHGSQRLRDALGNAPKEKMNNSRSKPTQDQIG
jgi:hypothetical protein